MAADKDLDEIIGAYLDGQLGEKDFAWLKQKLESDAQLAALVEELEIEKEIESYLEGKLTEEKSVLFEQKLTTDKRTQAVWEAYQMMHGLVKWKKREQYVDMLNSIESQQPGGFWQGNRKWFGLVGFLVLIVVGWKLIPPTMSSSDNDSQASPTEATEELNSHPGNSGSISNPGNLDTNEIIPSGTRTTTEEELDTSQSKNRPQALNSFKDNTDLQQFSSEILSLSNLESMGTADVDTLYYLWRRSYIDSNYQQVIALLAPLENTKLKERSHSKSLLAFGLANFYQKDFKTAQRALEGLLAFDPPVRSFEQQARWYFALAFLEMREERGLTVLQDIASKEDGHYRQEQAQLLLDSLLKQN